jgi:hypothetical protein
MQINANSDIADRLDSASYNGMRSVRSNHLREAAEEIRELRAALSPFVVAADAGHAPPLEAYDAARKALRRSANYGAMEKNNG